MIARLLCLLVLVAAPAFAQPRLVKDINVSVTQAGSNPLGLATIGNITFFQARHEATGTELWKTDGTEAGTELVRDIAPGPESGLPFDRFGTPVIGNRLFITADDGEHGLEPWVSDGTTQGTVMLADIAPGAAPSSAVGTRLVGNTLYFLPTSPAAGTELWRTDGTPAGTRLVVDLHPGPSSGILALLGNLGSLLVFRGTDGTNNGIYTTDGTAQGTRLISPLAALRGSSYRDMVLLTVAEPNTTPQTWALMRTDGTSAGTTTIRGGLSGNPSTVGFGVAGNLAWFIVNRTELWRTDGTAAGTFQLVDAGANIEGLRDLNGRMVFTTAGNPRKLWISDGSVAGTRVIRDINDGTPGVVAGNHYYFVFSETSDGSSPRRLWRTDGTTAGTSMVPGPPYAIQSTFLVARADGVFFTALDATNGIEPWISDARGTRMLKNIGTETSHGSDPSHVAGVGNRIIFIASSGTSRELWVTDGTSTERLPGVSPIEGVGSGPFYFFSQNPSRPELWRTDGTTAGTTRLSDLHTFDDATPLRGGLFFRGTDAQHGGEPWFTDGTVAGTRMLGDLYPGPAPSSLNEAVRAGDFVYFAASTPSGPALFRTDGTSVEQLKPAGGSAVPRAGGRLTPAGAYVYFISDVISFGFTLWRSSLATGELAPVRRFEGETTRLAMAELNGALLLFHEDELWRSDGTAAGTVRVTKGIAPPACTASDAIVTGNGAVFWLSTAERGLTALWRSDGTAAGTYAIREIPRPLFVCMGAYQLTFRDGRRYFAGTDHFRGTEPWLSDGTITGTRPLFDLNPGNASSDPEWFTVLGGNVFFSAMHAGTGRELWTMPVPCVGDCPTRRRVVRH